jgi:hypothetical protein
MTKKKDSRINMDTRPTSVFIGRTNYDYTSDGPDETSPGGGLYHGPMDKYKSVMDFRKKRKNQNERVKRRLKRKQAWDILINMIKAS